MSSMWIFVAAYAAVLVVASVSAQSAGSDGCLPGIKGIFHLKKGYAKLADHLFKATQSGEPADNIKHAGSLLGDNPSTKKDLTQLVQAFGSLRSDPSDVESFCSMDNLANLRRVAEGLRDGGNLGPGKITPAILRLNKIVIGIIISANNICIGFLERKLPESWKPKFKHPEMSTSIYHLQKVKPSYIYEGFYGDKSRVNTLHYEQIESISLALISNVPFIKHDAVDKTSIANELDKYVYKPCKEFVLIDEAKQLLAPCNEINKILYVVSSNSLDEYNKIDRNLGAYVIGPYSRNEWVRRLAYSYQACQRFDPASKEKLAKSISEYRVKDSQWDNGFF